MMCVSGVEMVQQPADGEAVADERAGRVERGEVGGQFEAKLDI